MIKVGQIYKTYDGIMVITQINKHIKAYDTIIFIMTVWCAIICDKMRSYHLEQSLLLNIQLGKRLLIARNLR